MEKAVHASFGDFVQIGGAGRLEGGPVLENRVTPVTKAVEEKKDAAHVGSPGRENG